MGCDEGDFAGRLAHARAGDPAAWRGLYEEVAPLVRGYLRGQGLHDPDDVAGEVLVEIVRGIGRFEGDAQGFRAWAVAIAHHRLLDARRREQRRPSTPSPPPALDVSVATDDPEAETIASLGLRQLEPALRDLTDEQREVLVLRVVEDLSVAEVAVRLGKRPGAIRQLQHRAAHRMRDLLSCPGTTPVEAAEPHELPRVIELPDGPAVPARSYVPA